MGADGIAFSVAVDKRHRRQSTRQAKIQTRRRLSVRGPTGPITNVMIEERRAAIAILRQAGNRMLPQPSMLAWVTIEGFQMTHGVYGTAVKFRSRRIAQPVIFNDLRRSNQLQYERHQQFVSVRTIYAGSSS